MVKAAAEGSSGIAVLVGGSSTGKTRACWEALQLLRDQKPGWRLWHPIDTSGASSRQMFSAVVQNTCRRLCHVHRPSPLASRHPVAR